MVVNETNGSGFFTGSTGFHFKYGPIHFIVTVAILGSFIVITVGGNILVILAVLLEKHLRNISNYLILSMAITDIIVACFVMNLSAINEVSDRWFMGVAVCDFWIFTDVLSCTASIFHLVTIALDRYWLVTNIEYKYKRTMTHLIIVIFSIWILSALIAIPSRFHFHRREKDMIEEVILRGRCLINGGYLYTLISTTIAFYAPMFFMMVVYYKIYQTAKTRIRKKQNRNYSVLLNMKCQTMGRNFNNFDKHDYSDCSLNSFNKTKSSFNVTDTTFCEFKYADNISMSSVNSEIRFQVNVVKDVHIARMSSMSSLRTIKVAVIPYNVTKDIVEQKVKLEGKREKKAIVTLAIITCCFILFWMPFFIQALVMPFCGQACHVHPIVSSIFLWLGYLNSLLNPLIYTIFSPDFRTAFKGILTGYFWNRWINRRRF